MKSPRLRNTAVAATLSAGMALSGSTPEGLPATPKPPAAVVAGTTAPRSGERIINIGSPDWARPADPFTADAIGVCLLERGGWLTVKDDTGTYTYTRQSETMHPGSTAGAECLTGELLDPTTVATMQQQNTFNDLAGQLAEAAAAPPGEEFTGYHGLLLPVDATPTAEGGHPFTPAGDYCPTEGEEVRTQGYLTTGEEVVQVVALPEPAAGRYISPRACQPGTIALLGTYQQ